MKMQLRLLVSCAALALTGLAFTGCGNDCAKGTTETDGECKVDTKACGAGTKLENGACILDTSGCGEGSSLKDGVCVADDPTGEECGDGTMFDSGTGKCVPNEVIECGANTMKVDSKCVPAGTVCTDGTMLNADGQCVVAAPACSTGTQLDPNTAKCVVTEQVCDTNTSFDAQTGTCKPSATVCATGTTFSTDTGLCLPDATCQMGDVIVEGKCYSPAEALYQATQTEGVENDDINLGGTANDVALPAMGMKTAIKGVIGLPVDLDNDGTLDQDVDVYKVTATAGQHIGVTMQAIGGPSLSFAVLGPDDYVRYAPIGVNRDAKRTVRIPKDGEYYIVVAPAIYLLDDSAGPIGEDSWQYVTEVELLPAPTATDVNTDNANITGSYGDLSNNLYKLTNLTNGGLIDITIKKSGKNVRGELQLWTSPTSQMATYPVGNVDETSTVVIPAGDVFVFMDWIAANGPALDYEVEVKPTPNQQNLGTAAPGSTNSTTAQALADDEVQYTTITLAAGEVLEVFQNNTEGEEVNIKIRTVEGENVFSRTAFDVQTDSAPDYAYVYSPNGGTYIIEAKATADLTGFVLNANSITPTDANLAAGSTNPQTAVNVDDERGVFYKVTLAAGEGFEFFQENTEGKEFDIRVYDATTGERVFLRTGFDVQSDYAPDYGYIYSATGGSYIVDAQSQVTTTNFVATFNSITPADAGTLAAGSTNPQAAINLTDERGTFYKLTMTAGEVLEMYQNNTEGEEVDITIFNATTGKQVRRITSFDVETDSNPDVLYKYNAQDSYVVLIESQTNITGFIPNFNSITPTDLGSINSMAQTVTQNSATLQGKQKRAIYSVTLSDNVGLTGTLAANDQGTAQFIVNSATGVGITAQSDTINIFALPAGTYFFSVLATNELNAGFNLNLTTTTTPTLYNNTLMQPVPIVDNASTQPISDTINVSSTCIIQNVYVGLNITHTWRGDLTVDLESPTGTVVRLHNRTGGSVDNIIGTYGSGLTPHEPLTNFTGDAIGNWTIRVSDSVSGDTGELNSWYMAFDCQ